MNTPGLAVLLEDNKMPEINLISCNGFRVEDDKDMVKFSSKVVKRVCKEREIDYRTHEEGHFEEWLAGQSYAIVSMQG